MSASISIDRTSLGKAALVISSEGTVAPSGATLRLTQEGVGYVVQSVRTTTAPPSINIDGIEIIGFAREATTLPIQFHILGATSAEVEAGKAELEEAFYRLEYPVTRTVDGESTTYSGGPCALAPVRASVDSGVVAAHFDTFAVSIPLPNPNGA